MINNTNKKMDKNLQENLQENDISIVMSQTNYTYQETCEKLIYHNYDKLKVIREYLGVVDKPMKQIPVQRVNQEIYKQIRKELDTSMFNYHKKNPINMEHVIQNFQESEENRKNKNIV